MNSTAEQILQPTRRHFLSQSTGLSLGAIALGGLLEQEAASATRAKRSGRPGRFAALCAEGQTRDLPHAIRRPVANRTL